MTTLNRNELRQELKAYREMGYTLQIKLTASTEVMREEYNRIHALDNAPVADGYDFGDMTCEELREAGVTITEADTGKHLDEYRATLEPLYLEILIRRYKEFARVCQVLLATNLEIIEGYSIVTISYDENMDVVDARVMMEQLKHQKALEGIGLTENEAREILEISGFFNRLKILEKEWRREEFIYDLKMKNLSSREILTNLRQYDSRQS